MTIMKRVLLGVAVFLLAVPCAGVSYASQAGQSSIVSNVERYAIPSEEDYTKEITVTYHQSSNTLDIQVVDRYTSAALFQQTYTSLETVSSWTSQPKVKINFLHLT